jgi:hypothetical protein
MRAVIHRAQETEAGDYHDHECEDCDKSMGCGSPAPFAVLPDEDHTPSEWVVLGVIAGECIFVNGETLCLSCAAQRGVTEWTLDPESTWDDDTVESVLNCPRFGIK